MLRHTRSLSQCLTVLLVLTATTFRAPQIPLFSRQLSLGIVAIDVTLPFLILGVRKR